MKSESERGPIGSWLVRERERRNLSAAEVAHKAGIPDASYRAIEAGRWMPRGDRLVALEAAIGSPAPDTKEAPPPQWATGLIADVSAIRNLEAQWVTELSAFRAILEAIGTPPRPRHVDPPGGPSVPPKGSKRDQ